MADFDDDEMMEEDEEEADELEGFQTEDAEVKIPEVPDDLEEDEDDDMELALDDEGNPVLDAEGNPMTVKELAETEEGDF
jgi:hypothetical protein